MRKLVSIIKENKLISVIMLAYVLVASVYIKLELEKISSSAWRIGCLDGGGTVSECARLEKIHNH